MSDAKKLLHAARLLKEGGLVAFPTETVYGLGADATNDNAIAAIYARKNRPQFNPLIIHFINKEAMVPHVVWNECAEKLANRFWPGPLTLVLDRKPDSGISMLASAGLTTLAVRVPAHEVAQQLMAEVGPLAAPSANISGRLSPTTAAHVHAELPDIEVLEGGACEVGLESTVVDVTDVPTLLRHGAITKEMLEQALGESVGTLTHADNIRSPGQLLKHYAPRAKLRLNATSVAANEALLAFGNIIPAGAKRVLNLSEKGDTTEAAANLFNCLRLLDQPDIAAIAVMPVPNVGIGEAINDRLQRGAA